MTEEFSTKSAGTSDYAGRPLVARPELEPDTAADLNHKFVGDGVIQ